MAGESMTTTTYDCGHPATEPGAHTPEGAHICRACAEKREYERFMADTREIQRAEGPFLAYISVDRRELTTWTGYKLASVTALWHQPAVGFGWRGGEGRWYFNAVDANGRKWYGTSQGPGMYARARLAKA